jgi:hypothetical protein
VRAVVVCLPVPSRRWGAASEKSILRGRRGEEKSRGRGETDCRESLSESACVSVCRSGGGRMKKAEDTTPHHTRKRAKCLLWDA